jgi:flagellar basal-body rod protein FlgB
VRIERAFFEDDNMRLMQRLLDVSVQRQLLISGNLANVDTPGYRTVDVDFQHELESATGSPVESLVLTNSNHMAAAGAASPPAAMEVEGLTFRNDLNNVNIDREMAQLSVNAFKFSMIAQLLVGKFRTLKSAILEGR